MFETATPSRSPSRGASTATDDIVWSPGGLAYAEFVPPEDVIVGRPGRLRFRIKGGHPSATNDKTRYVSVSETGRRVALIDEDDQVRVYFLADDKPFLSPLERDAWAISLDASWIATRRAPDLGRAIGHRRDPARGRQTVGSTPPDPHHPRCSCDPHLRGPECPDCRTRDRARQQRRVRRHDRKAPFRPASRARRSRSASAGKCCSYSLVMRFRS